VYSRCLAQSLVVATCFGQWRNSDNATDLQPVALRRAKPVSVVTGGAFPARYYRFSISQI